MKLDEGVRLSRIYLVDGPHKGEVVSHEPAHGPYLRRRALRGLEVRETLYRIFSVARSDAHDVADHFAGEWCAPCDMLRARCRHAPVVAARRWVRFGPRFDRTKLAADAPGSRESKWHLLRRADQPQEPWLTVCELIVYGPVVEEYCHAVLTPIDAPMCRRCKRSAGMEEHIVGATSRGSQRVRG